MKRVLIAGVGNDLRQDDAFGIEIARQLVSKDMGNGVKVMEVGIGGIHLVQELHYEYDILIMVDAVEWGGTPGTIYFREVESISDINEMPIDEKRAFLADMHYTNPVRALMLAKALDVLPDEVFMLGCEAEDHHDFAIGMSEAVKKAIPKAIEMLHDWLSKNT